MLSIRSSYLGELEIAVLEYLWSEGAMDAKDVHQGIGTQRGISLNTVQSALERLYRKKLLSREKVRHAYVYAPAVRREELMAQLMGQVAHVLSAGKGYDLLSTFVDFAARVDEHSLDRLEQLIAERRRQQQEDDPP
ncbi:BlaI/MecI/CopY family transcriptional regulator [Nitrosococcus oceani]|uniref:Penicillinase repressor n=2 Tax=Nitrosococcus oceani TaxID=1229 RepID=Q3JEC7_NITOC|nr:BlaI/MecI/CopY family transcriptional regulator [Nitrosococcus oceani]KFI20772.1 penicillinase repressor [Nitrosococcus oceani C-27]ABA56819.1 Penicillinase repressor [Nitrosococcus oceani ATCC 19707]EDZ66314.1 transcriptional regulator, BlaI/MecI/CopY family [Nitrosococcus oceani AFC27]KFI23844.1 penicillinase repressor [Nitrosococcus oceani]GEM20576.1 penicillinase repressor [Nitrosococcus oceani]